MTLEHARRIVEWVPGIREKVRLLDPEGYDISDPFGGDLETYREAMKEISGAAKKTLSRFGYIP
jgi:protein-tyrosine-phosphatase